MSPTHPRARDVPWRAIYTVSKSRTADVRWTTTQGESREGTSPPQTNAQNCADQGWIGGAEHGVASPVGNWNLGASMRLIAVKLYSVFSSDGRGRKVQVQGSNDLSTWEDVGSEFDYNTGTGACGYHRYNLA